MGNSTTWKKLRNLTILTVGEGEKQQKQTLQVRVKIGKETKTKTFGKHMPLSSIVEPIKF